MKKTEVILLLMLAFFCFSAAARRDRRQVDCSEFQNGRGGSVTYCAKVYEPYCGSDGKTYMNKCAFCEAVMRSNGTLRLRRRGVC